MTFCEPTNISTMTKNLGSILIRNLKFQTRNAMRATSRRMCPPFRQWTASRHRRDQYGSDRPGPELRLTFPIISAFRYSSFSRSIASCEEDCGGFPAPDRISGHPREGRGSIARVTALHRTANIPKGQYAIADASTRSPNAPFFYPRTPIDAFFKKDTHVTRTK